MTKWCQPHWDMLREGVEEQGLSDLVSANGEIAVMKTAGELQGADDLSTFDPLMRCFWMIENRILDLAGLAAMHPDFGCPICRHDEQRTEDGRCACPDPACPGKDQPGVIPSAETWLKGPGSAPESVREMALERGWIKA